MRNQKFIYYRLFEYCVQNDFKTTSRGIIRRKSRIPLGIFSYILIIGYVMLDLLDIYDNTVLLIIVLISAFGFIYLTRMGVSSWINIFKINKLRAKTRQNVLEKFCVYHNRDGNYIKIQEKQMYRIKRHPFCWSRVRIFFKDECKNKYIFSISLKNVSVSIHQSNAYRSKDFAKDHKELELRYKYNVSDMFEVKEVKELLMFIRNEYRRLRLKILVV
ncbi:hypothetical protein RJI07_08600 [Mycoplasmatota bacterium WC30]